MRKIFVIFLFCLFASFTSGEEFFVSKPGNKEGKTCQAVRIKDTWFLTAAHCVADICNTSCNVEMLIQGKIIETSQKNVFWLNENRGNNASYDIALINFKNAKIPGEFKEPQILVVDNSIKFTEPKVINRTLQIPFDIHGSIGSITSINPVFYGPKNKIIFTSDLGLFHGLSGAGVFTDKKEIVAVTSATAGRGDEIRFSVFSVFDEKVESFLRQKLPSLYFKHTSLADFNQVDESKVNKKILISLDD